MRKSPVLLSLLLSSLSLLSSASALAAYKCNDTGTITYRDAPCPNGQRISFDAVSNPDAEHAAHRSEQEKRQLKQLENERRKREAREDKERQRDAHVQAAKRKRCSLLAQRKSWAEEDAAAATGKSADRAKLKARRIAERYDEECGRQHELIGSSGSNG